MNVFSRNSATSCLADEVIRKDLDAFSGGTTKFPNRIVAPEDAPRVLVGGENNRKIGGRVAKGSWSGMKTYTLTLVERATCPAACAHLDDCYGDNMQWARRLVAGPGLVTCLDRELATLAAKHPAGLVVRLHVLGDFYSADYVRSWADWLRRHPNLHVYGYTGWLSESQIGRAVADLVSEFGWGRCAIRFSGGGLATRCAGRTSDKAARGRTPDGIVCLEQTGQSGWCCTCTLCWASEQNVVFIDH